MKPFTLSISELKKKLQLREAKRRKKYAL